MVNRNRYTVQTPPHGRMIVSETQFAGPASRAHPAEDSSTKPGEVMLSQETSAQTPQIQIWPIDRLVFYARNPRKNDSAVDRMCSSIREFGLKVPVLARTDGEVVDGHLRLKAARKLGITAIPVILCDEWSAAQVRAFRLMVNRSVTWASWDEDLLALELQEIQEADFDLSLTGFDPRSPSFWHLWRGRSQSHPGWTERGGNGEVCPRER
jgi:hypothetical protein